MAKIHPATRLIAQPAAVAGGAARTITAAPNIQAQAAQVAGNGRQVAQGQGVLQAQNAITAATAKLVKTGQGAAVAQAAQVIGSSIAPTALEADWNARISGPGVVWYHNFENEAEVDAFRWAGNIGNDPSDLGPLPDHCRHITSDFVSGGGCLEIIHPVGGAEPPGWWRPFSPLDTGSGKSVNDPAANGDLTVLPWVSTDGGSETALWSWGDYGPASTGSWDGNHYWLQIQMNLDQRRLDAREAGDEDSKIMYLTRTEKSLTDQEIVTHYGIFASENVFALYRGGSPPIPNNIAYVTNESGWRTYLYHIVLGAKEASADFGGLTQVHVWRQDWLGGDVEYTKIFEKYDLGLDYDSSYNFAQNAIQLSTYFGGHSDVEHYLRADELIFSRNWIPPKSTFSGSALETAADALSAGDWSLDPIPVPFVDVWDISWQMATARWDDMRRELHVMGKGQGGRAAKHWIYSEQADVWRTTSLDVSPGKAGHIWGHTMITSGDDVGDYFYIEQDPSSGAMSSTLRYMDRSVEAGLGTTNTPWTTLPTAPFVIHASGVQATFGFHPNLIGPGEPGIYVAGAFRSSYFDLARQTWTEVSTTQNLARDGDNVYVPGLDVLLMGNNLDPLKIVVIRAGEAGDTTPDTFDLPIGNYVTTGNHGKLILDPRDYSTVLMLEAIGNRVWSSSDGGQTWGPPESFTHPFWSNNPYTDTSSPDGGSWTACSVPRYGVIVGFGSQPSGGGSLLWRPG